MSAREGLQSEARAGIDRRRFIGYFASIGLGGTLLPGALWAAAQEAPEITPEMVAAAARIAGLPLTPEAEKAITTGLGRRGGLLQNFGELRELGLGNDTPSALVFNPVLPGTKLPAGESFLKPTKAKAAVPRTDEDLAFLPVTHLAALLRKREVKSIDLAKLCLERLKRYDPVLHCVVSLTEDLALEQAARADREIASGRYRGLLHGIPWGAKDLLAVKGYKTTFGASPYMDQTIDRDATVYERLTAAGAVLVAKLTLGALAMGDRWFGGQTKSPWDPKNANQGSSGSSAGPAAAVAAGLVPFAIGSETRGSIISPASRCGVDRPPALLRPGQPVRGHGPELDHGQDRAPRPDGRGLRHSPSRHPGPRRARQHGPRPPLRLGRGRDVRKLRVGYLKDDVEREIPDDPKNPDSGPEDEGSVRPSRRPPSTSSASSGSSRSRSSSRRWARGRWTSC